MPTGWDADRGNIEEGAFDPDVLLSVTSPVRGAFHHHGPHYIVARHQKKDLYEKYGCRLPAELQANVSQEIIGINQATQNAALQQMKNLDPGLVE